MYLDDAVAQYEQDVGPIAARKTTRTLAIYNIKQVFWTVMWPAIKDRTVSIKWGWFHPSFKISALQFLFEQLFGPPSDATQPSDSTAVPA